MPSDRSLQLEKVTVEKKEIFLMHLGLKPLFMLCFKASYDGLGSICDSIEDRSSTCYTVSYKY